MMPQSLHDICFCEGKLDGDEFVGIRCDGKPDGKGLAITFPLGYFANDEALRQLSEEELRDCVVNLFDVLSDPQLTNLQNSSIDSIDIQSPEKRSFPMQAYLHILRDFMDRGYFFERDIQYKQGANGKISWGRTIKQTQPVLSNGNIVYVNPIARRTNLDEDELITLIHKFCVHEAASKIGLVFGIEPSEESPLDFDAELFRSTLLQKLSRTFNDRDSMLFRNMIAMVEFLENGLAEDFTTPKDFYFGVNKFEGVWEKLIESIFGTVSDKSNYNPHLKFVAKDSSSTDGENLDDDGDTGDSLRSTLRPDTIMVHENCAFILDSKYYKYGITNGLKYLPGAESVCKQMAYAEHIENKKLFAADKIFNAFIMPCCAKEKTTPFGMEYKGYIYGDWKVIDNNQPYHKIACICLDIKSVMKNYYKNSTAQKDLANLIKAEIS